jgi:hypothetical protein
MPIKPLETCDFFGNYEKSVVLAEILESLKAHEKLLSDIASLLQSLEKKASDSAEQSKADFLEVSQRLDTLESKMASSLTCKDDILTMHNTFVTVLYNLILNVPAATLLPHTPIESSTSDIKHSH